MNLFEFNEYKDVIRAKIKENAGVHGYKGRLAEAAGCQRAYFSQVLNTAIHLTPDHAAGLALYWRLPANERDYFLDLVNLARASSQALRGLIEARLRELRANQETVSGRIRKATVEAPSLEAASRQALYYSSWHYSAIHILITIARYRSSKSIAKRLQLSEETVRAALALLEEMGLARRQKDQWTAISFDLHLPKHSPLNSINHMNWRIRAVQDSNQEIRDSLHFTAVYSLSEEDLRMLRARLLDIVSQSRELALKSKESELVAFTCDFFRV